MSGDKTPPRKITHVLIAWLIRTNLKVFFGLKVKGLENIPSQGAFILASNHQSLMDPPLIGSVCPRGLYVAAKKELLEIVVIGRIIRYLNAIPVRRSGYDRGVLKLLGEALDKGYGINIFPEGTRSRDGKLGKPRPGVGVLSKNHNAVVVPVYISGSSDLRKQFFKRKLVIKFGNPLDFKAQNFSDSKNEKEIYREISVEVLRSIAKTGGVSSPV